MKHWKNQIHFSLQIKILLLQAFQLEIHMSKDQPKLW